MQNQLKIGRNTMIRYFLNGAFLTVLSYLLIINPSLKSPAVSSTVDIRQAIMADIGPDSLITYIRSADLSVGQIRQVIDFLETDQLMGSERGQATCYALSKQVQQKINAGDRSKALRRVIDLLATYQMIVEVPKSDWSKLFTYSRECLFEDLHCDHLANRVTSHHYFKGSLVLLGLVLFSISYLAVRRMAYKKRLKITLTTE